MFALEKGVEYQMFNQVYRVMFFHPDYKIWETLGERGNPVDYGNKYQAQKKADWLCTTGQAQDAFVMKVTEAAYSCVVTRQTMVMTTYEAIMTG